MSDLIAFRSAVVAGLQARVTGLRSVGIVAGRFSDNELKEYSLNAPAVRIATLGWRRAEPVNASRMRVELEMAAFLIVRGRDRFDTGLALSEAVALEVGQNQWGVDRTELPTNLMIESLYDADVDREGVLLMAITWLQITQIGRALEPEATARADDLAVQAALGGRVDPVVTVPPDLTYDVDESP